jgi:steroid 5-alpha reductase family enzyme
LFFICIYQNFLLFLIALPILKCSVTSTPVGIFDYFLFFLILLLITIETISDNQQQAFQKEKYRRINNKLPMGEYEKGFIDTGLFAWSRHPNFLCEQCIWIVFYLFSVSSSGEIINWSISGCILLTALFHGSTDFTEEVSLSKYPKYKEYQKKTPRLIPIKF